MKRKLFALLAGGLIAVMSVAPSFASTPQGQKGYEGKPGNQGGYHQAGQKGYEGQPGNQSHNK